MTTRWRRQGGFTLLELMIVVSIVGILATIAVPSYADSILKAREAALRQSLFTVRDAIDQFRVDRGKYPINIRDLVDSQYLRMIPKDPFTNSSSTWQVISDPEGGIFDIRSGSELVARNGEPYNRW